MPDDFICAECFQPEKWCVCKGIKLSFKMEDPKMKFYRLTEIATIPRKATPGSAGFDLFSINSEIIWAGCRIMVPTGIACEISDGWYGRIAPRSGLAVKYGIDVLAGVIDSDYRGEIKVILQNHGSHEVEIESNQAIAQLIFEHCYNDHVEIITDFDDIKSETERGDGGFGSTGV